ERLLAAFAQKRLRMAVIASCIAVVGVLVFIAVLKMAKKPSRSDASTIEAIRNAPAVIVSPPKPKPPAPDLPAAKPPDDEKPPPAEGELGSVTIESDAPAMVFIDGKALHRTPLRKYPLTGGNHKVALVNAR